MHSGTLCKISGIGIFANFFCKKWILIPGVVCVCDIYRQSRKIANIAICETGDAIAGSAMHLRDRRSRKIANVASREIGELAL
jgi:hypothetical protein